MFKIKDRQKTHYFSNACEILKVTEPVHRVEYNRATQEKEDEWALRVLFADSKYGEAFYFDTQEDAQAAFETLKSKLA